LGIAGNSLSKQEKQLRSLSTFVFKLARPYFVISLHFGFAGTKYKIYFKQ
jgi:hypothetical protein